MEALKRAMEVRPLQTKEMCWGTLGTVRPYPNFNAGKDAQELHCALESKVTDVNTLVRILTNRNNAQRRSIAESYHNLTQKDLSPALRKVLSGVLQDLMLGLLMTPAQMDAHRLRHTMEGLGTDEEGLLEVLCTRSPQQLRDITVAYKQEFDRYLENDLISETSKDFTKLVLAILKKEETNTKGVTDYQLIDQDTLTLNAAVSAKRTDPAPWIQVLTTRDSAHLNKVFSKLEALRKETMEKMVQTHFSKDVKIGFRILVCCIQSIPAYLAQRLHNTIKKGRVTQWILTSRSENDLLCVRMEFRKLTNNSLYSTLQREYKGEVQQALLALCRSEDL